MSIADTNKKGFIRLHPFLAASLLGGSQNQFDLPLTPKQLRIAQSFFGGDNLLP